jgi:alanine racemase
MELNRSALRGNLRYVRRQIGRTPLVSSVIKGDAYGHGIEHWIPMAEDCGVNHFSVFGADEAERALEVAAPSTHIMIMGFLPDDEVEWAVAKGCSFFVFDIQRLEAAIAATRATGKAARVHLELETGLNRTGWTGRELEAALDMLHEADDKLELEGLCTHFAGAESSSNFFRIEQQMRRFTELCDLVEQRGHHARYRHAACSAAALTYPDSILDMVRIGIALYGFWPSQETRMRVLQATRVDKMPPRHDPLTRVMRWTSTVMTVNNVAPGEFVGYGNAYLTNRPHRVAAVPVGYFHGFPRGIGNLGHVLVHGRRAGVVGHVNMNMMLVDVTDIPAVQRGDEVVIIGRQKRSQITVGAFGDLTQDLNYEVLVRIPRSVTRRVVEGK